MSLERHEVAAPFRYILSWWGGARRKPLIHAGAVAARRTLCAPSPVEGARESRPPLSGVLRMALAISRTTI